MFLYKCSLKLLLLFQIFSTIYGIWEGKEVTSAPYMAAVREELVHGFYLCSGAIIASDWVLSHASCLLKLRGRVVVMVATINVEFPNVTSDIKDVILHEKYNPVADVKNIALVQTMSNLVSDVAIPAKLPTKEWGSYTGCTLTGYGIRSYFTMYSHKRNMSYGILHQGAVSSPTYKDECGCLEKNVFNDTQKGDYVCNSQGDGRICIGDFGAPLICQTDEGKEEIVAVAHNFMACKDYNALDAYCKDHKSSPCGAEQSTDIYTYLYPYRKWIINKIRQRYNMSVSYSYANCLPITSKLFFCLLISRILYHL